MAETLMRNVVSLAAAAGLWLALGSAPGFCQDGDGRSEAGAISAEISAGPAFVTVAGFGAGLRYGGAVHKKVGDRLALEILLEAYAVPVAEGTAGLGAGRLDITPLLFNGYLYFSNRGSIRPFVVAGAGFFFLHFTPDSEPVSPEKDFVGRFALQLGGGTDFKLTGVVTLTAKVRYNMVKTWIEELPRTVPIGLVDPRDMDIIHLYALVVSLGIKFRF